MPSLVIPKKQPENIIDKAEKYIVKKVKESICTSVAAAGSGFSAGYTIEKKASGSTVAAIGKGVIGAAAGVTINLLGSTADSMANKVIKVFGGTD